MKETGTTQSSPYHKEPSPQQRRLLLLILALALVRGIVYLGVFPPWQHYDEPTHFEYVRLIAERGCCPEPTDYDLEMRQEIASSMQSADFWKGKRIPTIDFWSETPPDIGLSELKHPPLYYILQALPQRLVAHQSVETQLYVARLGSILLNLVVVACAYGVVTEIFPERRWLPLAVAAFVSLLPPFTDLMSGVNNDAGAAAAASLLLWAAVRLIRRGASLGRIASVLLLAGICVATKSTASIAAVVILVALIAGHVPRKYQRWLWGGLALLIAIGLAASLTWGGHAAHWYNNSRPSGTNRVPTAAPVGRSVLALSSDGKEHPRALLQELGREEGQGLRDHTVTLGAWLKAANEAGGTTVKLGLDDGPNYHQQVIVATGEWVFHAFTETIDRDASGIAVSITIPKSNAAAQEVYADGLVLIDGIAPADTAPQFDTVEAEAGVWGSQRFTNLLQNGSAEKVWPSLRAWIGDLALFRFSVAQIFHSLWDWPRTTWVYVYEFRILLQSFWGGFGWNHLSLPTGFFLLLGLLSLAGIAGSGISLWRHGNVQGWRIWATLGAALLASWGGAVMRVHPVFITQHIFWPVARYATVAIVPTALVLCMGLAEIVPRRWVREAAWIALLGLAALDAIAVLSVVLPYYYG